MTERNNINNIRPGELIILRFPGLPKAVQSVRVAMAHGFMRKYQPKDVVEWKNYIRIMAREQLPPGFRPLAPTDRECIEFRSVFTFPLRTSETKTTMAYVASGGRIMHARKPDITDNLMKGLCDALTGILWTDDARVCHVDSVKVDGENPSVDISVQLREAKMDRLDVDAFLKGESNGIQWGVAVP